MKQPPKWKFAIMVWIAIYPAITLASFLIGDAITKPTISNSNINHDRNFSAINGIYIITFTGKNYEKLATQII